MKRRAPGSPRIFDSSKLKEEEETNEAANKEEKVKEIDIQYGKDQSKDITLPLIKLDKVNNNLNISTSEVNSTKRSARIHELFSEYKYYSKK